MLLYQIKKTSQEAEGKVLKFPKIYPFLFNQKPKVDIDVNSFTIELTSHDCDQSMEKVNDRPLMTKIEEHLP